MADHLDELKQLAHGFAANEAVYGAADVVYGGKVNLNQAPTGLAALGHHEAQVAAGEAMAQRYGDRPDVTFPSAKQMALVVTDSRVLIWSRGGLKGKPKAYLGEVPLDVISEVVGDDHHAGRLTIRLGSGWDVQLDVTRDDGCGFGDLLVAAVERANPTASVTPFPGEARMDPPTADPAPAEVEEDPGTAGWQGF